MAGLGLNLDTVFDRLGTATTYMEDKLRQTIEDSSDATGGISTQNMLKIQQDMQNWTLATNVQSNVLKGLSDAVKSVIQNVR